jgi:heavy metal efflux system protein
MIQRLVAAALRMPFVVISVVVVIIIAGLGAYRALDIEAYPNPVPPLVEVITQPPGWSAEEVERYVTIPLEIGLSGMPGLDHVRSQSIFGLSDVKCYLRWGNDYKDVRQEVINRIQFVTLPAGTRRSNTFATTISSPLGWISFPITTAATWSRSRRTRSWRT